MPKTMYMVCRDRQEGPLMLREKLMTDGTFSRFGPLRLFKNLDEASSWIAHYVGKDPGVHIRYYIRRCEVR